MIYDHYGYPIFPGDRGYSSCGGDVDRYDTKATVEETAGPMNGVRPYVRATYDTRATVEDEVDKIDRQQ